MLAFIRNSLSQNWYERMSIAKFAEFPYKNGTVDQHQHFSSTPCSNWPDFCVATPTHFHAHDSTLRWQPNKSSKGRDLKVELDSDS